jgi:hypothetical protein
MCDGIVPWQECSLYGLLKSLHLLLSIGSPRWPPSQDKVSHIEFPIKTHLVKDNSNGLAVSDKNKFKTLAQRVQI